MATMKCPRCDSENIMPNLRIRDRYERGLGQDLEVEVQGNPDALIFKQSHREALRATVCGECGNVGLSVENPKGLWETYSQIENS
ncbi:MAG: hypothetical protein OXI67_03235 [Candidatus Poribacteria bacterium]|nr:hypothetical protein [Candidatus Poribacteria bacterium]